MAAFLELTCSLFYSPFIFLRVFFRHDSLVRNPKVRRRVWLELIVAALTGWAGQCRTLASEDLDQKVVAIAKQVGALYRDAKALHVDATLATTAGEGDEKRETTIAATFDG